MEVPGTPDELKKYRKAHVNEPGKIQKHWGVADDGLKHAPGYVYGKQTFSSNPLNTVIKAQNLSGMADKFNDIMEAKYRSNVKEPLGKGM